MKICVASKLSPTYLGGLAAYERTLIRLLVAEPGVHLDVVYGAEPNGLFPPAEAATDFSPKKIRERRLTSYFRPIHSRLATRRFTQGLLKRFLAASWEFPDHMKPDAIHFVGTGWDFFGFGLAHLAKRRKSRLTIWPAIHPRSWGDDEIDLRLYQQADLVLCQSEEERDHLERLGLPKTKSVRCPVPPMCRRDGDADRFRAKANLLGRPLVLFLGRRDQGKGYGSLLLAWRIVAARVPGAVLMLAGPGGMQDQEQLQLAQIPPGTLHDLGIPGEIEKADALAACDVFCLPSAHESFGIVYVEAWSYGKPVICGPAPASRELVEDGRTGLWSSQNPDELAEKILLLLQNERLRNTIGTAGLALQKERFNEQLFLDTHLQTFRS